MVSSISRTALKRPTSSDSASQRLTALIESGLLDSDPEAAFDRYTRLARKIVGAPVALVSLVTDTRQFFKSACGLEGAVAERRQTPISGSFCRYVLPGEPLIVADAREHPLLANNPAIENLSAIAYAGFPIRNSEGLVFGAMCVIDHQPRSWNADDLETLSDLADGVSSEIRLREQLLRETQREQELRLALSRLEGVERFLNSQLRHHEETAAMVTHDLRTPLSSLLFSVGMLEDENDPVRRTRLVNRMRAAIEDMDKLVGDLLDVVRINAGGISYDLKPVSCVDLVRRLRDLHVDEARDKSVTLHCHADPLVVNADAGRMVQALSNLVGNALRAVDAHGVIEIRATGDGEHVEFTVADDGPGIDQAQLDALFARYSQGASAGRAGLGLAIAKAIAEGHGGTLSAQSSPGEGAVFHLRIPCARA